MRVLIYGLNYSPEPIGIGKYTGEMVKWLVAQGHELRVITAPPYYPQWQVLPGYSASRWTHETIDGVAVTRCPLWIPSRLSGLKRLLHLASFALSSLLPVLWQARKFRPHVIFVVEPTAFCAPGALLAAQLSGARSWLHIQDYELDAAFALGLLGAPRLQGGLAATERYFKKRFDRVSTISPRMQDKLSGKGVALQHQVLFPNWVDVNAICPLPHISPMRQEWGIDPNSIVALYSGNLGAKQGAELLLQAAASLKNHKNLVFILCGDGGERQKLEKAAHGLTNVRFFPLQPITKLNELLNIADIHLLPQRADAADLVMPSKLTGMLASGRPVVTTAAIGTQVAEVVTGRGVVVAPGDTSAFSVAISELAQDKGRRLTLGQEARRYAEKHLNKDYILSAFEKELANLVVQSVKVEP